MSHRSRHHHVHIREVGLPTPLARAEVQDVVPCDLSFRPSSNADVVAAPIDHAHDATQHPKSVCREDFSSSIGWILFGGDGEDFQLTICTPLLDPQTLRARGVSKARRGGQPRHQRAPHHHYDASRSPETPPDAPQHPMMLQGRLMAHAALAIFTISKGLTWVLLFCGFAKQAGQGAVGGEGRDRAIRV